jgi:hypothetical protein
VGDRLRIFLRERFARSLYVRAALPVLSQHTISGEPQNDCEAVAKERGRMVGDAIPTLVVRAHDAGLIDSRPTMRLHAARLAGDLH